MSTRSIWSYFEFKLFATTCAVFALVDIVLAFLVMGVSVGFQMGVEPRYPYGTYYFGTLSMTTLLSFVWLLSEAWKPHEKDRREEEARLGSTHGTSPDDVIYKNSRKQGGVHHYAWAWDRQKIMGAYGSYSTERAAAEKRLVAIEKLDRYLGFILLEIDRCWRAPNVQVPADALVAGLNREVGSDEQRSVFWIFSRGGSLVKIQTWASTYSYVLNDGYRSYDAGPNFHVFVDGRFVLECSTAGRSCTVAEDTPDEHEIVYGPYYFSYDRITRFIDGPWTRILEAFSEELKISLWRLDWWEARCGQLAAQEEERRRLENMKNSFGV